MDVPPTPERLQTLPEDDDAISFTTQTDNNDDLLSLPDHASMTSATRGQRSSLGITAGTGRHDDPLTPLHNRPGRTFSSRHMSSARPSFSTFRGSVRRMSRRPSNVLDGMEDDTPRLPTLVPGIRPAYSTPLPVLPMLVLCIAMLSELLSANLCTPFMPKMVHGFLVRQGSTGDISAEAGKWTGYVVSAFYITQFLTSLLWSSIADKHGRRAVIVASMAGSAVAMFMFGLSNSLPEAICVRLIQGVFGGAVGVYRGSIRDLTDDTNASRAYGLLGYCWGLGGVVGPVIGGVFESPAQNFAGSWLGNIPLFHDLPYLLPTLLGGLILITNAVLACFLSWDGGVRGGARLQLEVEKDEPLIPSRTQSRAPSHSALAIATPANPHSQAAEEAGGATLSTSMRLRRESVASLGTAYGYGGIRSKHPTLAARAALQAARRASNMSDDGAEDDGGDRKVSMATKFLLAAEENTFNINDLWVSAAVAEDTAVFDEDEEDDYDDDEPPSPGHRLVDLDDATTTDAGDSMVSQQHLFSPSTETPGAGLNRTSTVGSRTSRSRRATSSGSELLHRSLGRRPSATSRRLSISSGVAPSIFANTGLAPTSTPGLAAYEHEQYDPLDPFSPPGTTPRRPGGMGHLTAISEQHLSSGEGTPPVGSHPQPSPSPTMQSVDEKETPRWKMLPLLVISQYAMLACHDSTNAQMFLSYILTDYESGGVGLTPADYSVLVALMCIGQLIYQFYLYPRLGPPLGKFSQLQMFRLGCMLYIPSYLLLPLLHIITNGEKPGGFIVMTSMTLISCLRYCGGTFAYTSIMILINVMSPPHLVGVANGLAQSLVSVSRFMGPAVGGALWGASIDGNPGGYPRPFYLVAIVGFLQLMGSLFIR